MADLTEKVYYQDWTKVLVSRLATSQTWYDLFDGVSKVFALNIYEKVYALSQIRNPDEQSRDINIKASKFLGFDYKSDTFSDEEFTTLVTFLNQFNRKYKGTKSFISFLGFVKDARFDMYQLWAKGKGKDYGEFERYSPFVESNSKISGKGTQEYYPTSHVELDYDGEKFNISTQDVYELFYSVAPAHLVLNRITANFYADVAPLFFGTSAGTDYYNIHDVCPCDAKYYVPLNLLTVPPIQKARRSGNFEGFVCYNGDNEIQTGLPRFDGFSTPEEVLKQFTFSRYGTATYFPKNSVEYRISSQDVPRLCFTKGTDIDLGLRIEKPSSNMLVKCTQPIRRTLWLQIGTYTFSCNGKYKIFVNSSEIQTVSNSTYTFILMDTSAVSFEPVTLPEIQPWFQLERGSQATSLIVTDAVNISSRGYEYLSLDSFPNVNDEFTVLVEYNKILTDCCLLVAFQTQTNYVKLRREGDLIKITVVVGGNILQQNTVPFTESIAFSLKSDKIVVNGNVFNFINGNVPFPTRFFIGSDLAMDIIDGYIKKFEYYPVFPEVN